jgi:orotate phosphoribosyltransferase
MLTYERTDDYELTISDEGLRRAANDNQLLAKTALAHEILAGAACGGIVVAIVWAIFRSL